MNISRKGKIHFKEPKGTGTLKYKNETVEFENAITIFGKAHIHNAILLNCWSTEPTIPKITGMSILCRRTHKDATNTYARLGKSFFELNIVRSGTGSTGQKANAMTDSNGLIPASATGQGQDVASGDANMYLQVGTGDTKLTAGTDGSTSGVWGSELGNGNLLTNIWQNESERLGNANPNNEGVGLQTNTDNLKKARIAGISLICGNNYGSWSDTVDGSNNATSYSKKVWREPAYLQLIHEEEALRKDYGYAEHGSTFDKGDNDTSNDIKHAGHYFPDVESLHSADPNGTTPARAESQNADAWEWKHVAHDTFASTMFLTHYYVAQEGDSQQPYESNSIADQHRIKITTADGDIYTDPQTNTQNASEQSFSGDINLNFSDKTLTQDGGGDAVLPQTISTFEVDYNTGDVTTPDHLIDSNDEISAKYTIAFTHVAHGPGGTGDLNEIGEIDNDININLAKALTKDLSNASGAFLETPSSVESAITHARLYDEDGNQMHTSNNTGSGSNNVSPNLLTNILQATKDPITFEIDEGYTKINNGDSAFADASSKRPRVWQTTIQIKFENVKVNSTGTNKNPHSVKFFNGTHETNNYLCEIQLADSSAQNVHNTQNPIDDDGAFDDDAHFDLFSNGGDLPNNQWEDENNLIVDITFYTG